MSMESEIARLEDSLDDIDDPQERRFVEDEIREMERELSDQERWVDDGRDRGWI